MSMEEFWEIVGLLNGQKEVEARGRLDRLRVQNPVAHAVLMRALQDLANGPETPLRTFARRLLGTS